MLIVVLNHDLRIKNNLIVKSYVINVYIDSLM